MSITICPKKCGRSYAVTAFSGLVIPKKDGGMGFSNTAHSEIVMKISTRSVSHCGHRDGAQLSWGPVSC